MAYKTVIQKENRGVVIKGVQKPTIIIVANF